MSNSFNYDHPGVIFAMKEVEGSNWEKAKAKIIREIDALQNKGNGPGAKDAFNNQTSVKVGVNITREMQKILHNLEVAQVFLDVSDHNHPNAIRRLVNVQNGRKSDGSPTMSTLWDRILTEQEQKKTQKADHRNGIPAVSVTLGRAR